MSLLEAKGVAMRFGGLMALSSVDLEVPTGAIRGLIGPNGSGKTTFFNVITGVYKPTAGRIRCKDSDITGIAPHKITRCGIARTFQNIRLFQEMSVLDNIKVGSHCRTSVGLLGALLRNKRAFQEEKETEEEAVKIAEMLNLTDVLGESPKNLAYGKQRLVEIGRALASRPSLILLDEPCAGMNPSEIEILIKYIQKIQQQGYTILLVEHHMKLVMQVCHHIFVLNFGKKIAEGNPEEILGNPLVIEAYLGKGAGMKQAEQGVSKRC